MMEQTNSAFVLITRFPNLRFSVAAVNNIKDISLDNQKLLSHFLYEAVDAFDLEALTILDANSVPIATLWFDEQQSQDRNGDEVSAVITPPGGRACQFLCGNLVILGPGDDDGNLTFLHPSRAFALADALNASEKIMLGPNAFMRICLLPLTRDIAWRYRQS